MNEAHRSVAMASNFDEFSTDLRQRTYAAVAEQVPRLSWDRASLDRHRAESLQLTLHHAVQRSPFHRERLAGMDLAAVRPDDLSALPTMSKSDVMSEWDRLVTDERLTISAARDHLARTANGTPELFLDEYLIFTTGGSTGEPGVFAWHRDEMARWSASIARYSAAAGSQPPEKEVWVGARSTHHPTGIAAYATGGMKAGQRLTVPIDQPIEALVAALNDIDPDAMFVVSSMLRTLAEAQRAGDLKINLKRIAIGGDVAEPEAVDDAAEAFGVRPLEAYPTTDVGHLAVQPDPDEPMVAADDLMIIEPVDADGSPTQVGDLCDHLLITSLHQRTMPLIRYRLDDRVRIGEQLNAFPAYSRILEVDGRSDDVFVYQRARVHPHVFRTVMADEHRITDYQVNQTRTGADVTVVAPAGFDSEPIRLRLESQLQRAGLSEPCVNINCSDHIARTAMGKRRRFIPTAIH